MLWKPSQDLERHNWHTKVMPDIPCKTEVAATPRKTERRTKDENAGSRGDRYPIHKICVCFPGGDDSPVKKKKQKLRYRLNGGGGGGGGVRIKCLK